MGQTVFQNVVSNFVEHLDRSRALAVVGGADLQVLCASVRGQWRVSAINAV